MRDRLFSLHGIEPGEKYIVSMLLAQALFLGIFVGAFDISAHSLFLSVYNEKNLAVGYFVSGLTGMILLSGYFFMHARVKLRNFVFYNLFFVAVITLALWVILRNVHSSLVLFIVFIMLGPLNIISVMGLRSAAGSVLAHSRGNRLFAITDTAFIVGIIFICLLIPIILFLGFDLRNVLLISAVSVFISAFLQAIAAGRQVPAAGNTGNRPEGFKSTISLLNIFRSDGYSRIMAIFIVLSVVSAFFIQYLFLALTRQQFPAAVDMAVFLSLFTGGIVILTLLGKLMLFSYLLRRYGLRFCLAISPVLLAFFTAVAIIVGLALGYRLETASGFLIFFILLGLLRFLSRSMDDSIESQSFKLLYQTFDEKVRFGVQSVLDSTVREAAAFLAGLVLAGVGVLWFIRLIHFSWILLAILLLWLYVALRLYSAYRNSLRMSLQPAKPSGIPVKTVKDPPVYKSRFYGERVFRLDYFNLVSGDFRVFEKTRNKFYFSRIIDYASAINDTNLIPALKKMNTARFDGETRKQSAEVINNLNSNLTGRSGENDRISSARKALSDTRMPQTTGILRLLREKSLESKRHAIYLIGKFRLSDMLPEVCECLNIQGLEADAAAVLRAFGSTASEELVRFYLVSSGNINSSKTIIRLLSHLPQSEDSGFLFSRLWSNSRQLKELALQCLRDSNFRLTAEDRERINQLISEIAGIITWTLSARRFMEKNNDGILLNEINKELNRWSAFLLNLLTVAYDPAAVTRIRKNLEFETVESVHYAHAIIDIIVDESVKAKVIYLLDIIPDDEKLKNLKRFYPVEIREYDRLLEEILNRDYNLISIWTKACVLRKIREIKDPEIAESVIALLFSPENLLQEEAVRLLARSDIKLYKSVYSRIPYLTRRHLDRIIEGEIDVKELLFDKVEFLRSCLTGILEEELLLLARKMVYYDNQKDLLEGLPNGYLLWSFENGSRDSSALIAYSSRRDELMGKIAAERNSWSYILPFKALDEFLDHNPDSTDSVMGYIEECKS